MNTPHPDQRYLEALIANDSRVIEEIYARFAGKVKIIITSRGGNAHDAKDVFQDALIKITRKARRGFELTTSFENFFGLLCRDVWVMQLKNSGGPISPPPVDPADRVTIGGGGGYVDDETALVEQLLREEARYDLFQRCFQQLGETCKKILKPCFEGKKLTEIAEILGYSYNYIRRKKAECLQVLIKCIKKNAGK